MNKKTNFIVLQAKLRSKVSRRLTLLILLTAFFTVSVFTVKAETITLTLPEYNGAEYQPNTPFPLSPVTVGTFQYTIPTGQKIKSARFVGQFGNSTNPSSAAVDIKLNGILVGRCAYRASCWFSTVSYSHTFTESELSSLESGMAVLTATQTSEYNIRLGVSRLIIETDSGQCKVSELSEITDSEAINFENSAPNTPAYSLSYSYIPLDLEFAVMRFLSDLRFNLGITSTRQSGHRPFAYQAHLREIRDKRAKLIQAINQDPAQKEACADLIEKINNEITTKHQLTCGNGLCGPNQIPAVSKPQASNHSLLPAQAIDLGNIKGQSAATQSKIDTLASKHGLWRPYKTNDPVHFEMFSTPPWQTLEVMMESPVDILVTDSSGRKVGFDPATNSVVNQIGELAEYSGPGTEPQIIEISGANLGSYLITGIGTGTGPYKLTVRRYSEDGELIESTEKTGNITLGQVISLTKIIAQPTLIDIQPNSAGNLAYINVNSFEKIPVAIISTQTFDAFTEIDIASLTFGRTGDEQSRTSQLKVEDVNGDGLRDLVVYFETQKTGFQAGDTQGILKGKLKNNMPFEGTDWISAFQGRIGGSTLLP